MQDREMPKPLRVHGTSHRGMARAGATHLGKGVFQSPFLPGGAACGLWNKDEGGGTFCALDLMPSAGLNA